MIADKFPAEKLSDAAYRHITLKGLPYACR